MDDCDKFVKQAIPDIEFTDPEYPSAGEKDRYSLRVTDFKQSYDYTNTLYGQIYSYYAILERVFKFEFSLTKINSDLHETIALEEAVNIGLPFWSVDPESHISKKKNDAHQSDNGGKNTIAAPVTKLSERAVEKLVAEKRAKINLAEEIVNLSTTIGQLLDRAQ